jgi:FlaA1/EpsC-like NDP-sugar epimerase
MRDPRTTSSVGTNMAVHTDVDVVPVRETDTDLASRIVRRLRRDVPLAVLDLALVFPAYLGPLALQFEGRIPHFYWHNFWLFIPIVAALHLLANYVFGLYGQMWRYASIEEARRLALAGAASFLMIVVCGGLFLFVGPQPLPLATVVLGCGLSVAAFGAVRFQSRLFGFRRRTLRGDDRRPTRILLMGAGDAGAQVLKDILTHPTMSLDPVGIVDDDPRKLGLHLHGVRILGTRSAIPALTERLEVDEVLLAIPSAASDVVRDVAAVCEVAQVHLRVLPSVREIVGGRVAARDIRDLRIEDLLGRQQVETDLESVRRLLVGRRVMITGAGGSIGSEIARQVAEFEPASLILLDNDETHLHDVQTALWLTCPIEVVLADVRERPRIVEACDRHRPEIVFHAAALKHVPVLETHPREAAHTNVIGTANVVDAAVASGTERCVLISSDKAINPVSVMGASKRIAEDVVRSFSGGAFLACVVRFGNVLGSRGSVIPTFLRQIEAGGPVTVTDPAMTRYFMSVQEAVQLVLQAAAMSQGGEIYTLEMGEQMRIIDLARKVIRLAGRVPDRDVPITITGIRPGEKLAEELYEPEVGSSPTDHPGIRASQPPLPDRDGLLHRLGELEGLVADGRDDELIEALGARRPPRTEPILVVPETVVDLDAGAVAIEEAS